jgi:hypothetical protein
MKRNGHLFTSTQPFQARYASEGSPEKEARMRASIASGAYVEFVLFSTLYVAPASSAETWQMLYMH